MKVFEEKHSERFTAYRADCVEFAASLPDNCIDLSVYSPPFSSLYVYSESERDMAMSKTTKISSPATCI